MDQHRLPNIALYGRVEGKRVKGRPRKLWLDNVTDDSYRRGWSIVEATHLATDRQRWRTYIRLSQRAPASPWQQEEESAHLFKNTFIAEIGNIIIIIYIYYLCITQWMQH